MPWGGRRRAGCHGNAGEQHSKQDVHNKGLLKYLPGIWASPYFCGSFRDAAAMGNALLLSEPYVILTSQAKRLYSK